MAKSTQKANAQKTKMKANVMEVNNIVAYAKWEQKLSQFKSWRKRDVCKSQRLSRVYLKDLFLKIVSEMSIGEDWLCLDVGCGLGGYLSEIIKQHNCRGIGLDPLKGSSLGAFKKRVAACKELSEINLIQGIGENLPLEDNSINLCIMTAALDHVANPEQTFKEINRILTPQGYFLLLQSVEKKLKVDHDNETHVNEFTLASLKALFKNFKILESTDVYCLPAAVPVWNKTVYTYLSKLCGPIGSFYNGSIAIIVSRKKAEQ